MVTIREELYSGAEDTSAPNLPVVAQEKEFRQPLLHDPAVGALSVAAETAISPLPLLMCVNVASAAALLTPVATPANMTVVGPGGATSVTTRNSVSPYCCSTS